MLVEEGEKAEESPSACKVLVFFHPLCSLCTITLGRVKFLGLTLSCNDQCKEEIQVCV